MNEKRDRNHHIAVLLMTVGFFLLLSGIIVMAIFVEFVLVFIPIIGVAALMIGFLVYRELEKTGQQDTINLDNVIEEVQSEKRIKNESKVRIEYLYKEVKPVDDAICMISKIPLEYKTDVLQCPNCESYFLGKYLREWVRDENECPVCRFRLKIIVKKES